MLKVLLNLATPIIKLAKFVNIGNKKIRKWFGNSPEDLFYIYFYKI
jgi:hypothetical protein